jgi:hypothetical protein
MGGVGGTLSAVALGVFIGGVAAAGLLAALFWWEQKTRREKMDAEYRELCEKSSAR